MWRAFPTRQCPRGSPAIWLTWPNAPSGLTSIRYAPVSPPSHKLKPEPSTQKLEDKNSYSRIKFFYPDSLPSLPKILRKTFSVLSTPGATAICGWWMPWAGSTPACSMCRWSPRPRFWSLLGPTLASTTPSWAGWTLEMKLFVSSFGFGSFFGDKWSQNNFHWSQTHS